MRFLLFFASLTLGTCALAAQLQYRVQIGDTAFSVAKRYNMTVAELLRLNHLQSAGLYAGQLLTVSLSDSATTLPSAPSTLAPAGTTASTGNALNGTLPGLAELPGTTTFNSAPVSLPTAPGNPFQTAAPGAARIRLGQAGSVNAPAARTAQKVSATVSTAVNSAGINTLRGVYQVARGDTAFAIARRSGLSVDALLAMNNLSSSDLRVGQWLSLDGAPHPGTLSAQPGSIGVVPVTPVQSPPAAPPASQLAPLPISQLPSQATVQLGDAAGLALLSAAPAGSLRARAATFLGVPYVYGGASASGTDCSGLVVQLFSALGLNLPRRSVDEFSVGTPVDVSVLTEGDLVFFATTGSGEVSHVGVYLADGYFLDANSYLGHVALDKLSDRYYASRYLGARRVLPSTPTQATAPAQVPAQSASNWTATSSPLGSR